MIETMILVFKTGTKIRFNNLNKANVLNKYKKEGLRINAKNVRLVQLFSKNNDKCQTKDFMYLILRKLEREAQITLNGEHVLKTEVPGLIWQKN